MDDTEDLIGKRFVTDFVIGGVAKNAERTVTLYVLGETYEVALAELRVIIDSGFVKEVRDPPRRPS